MIFVEVGDIVISYGDERENLGKLLSVQSKYITSAMWIQKPSNQEHIQKHLESLKIKELFTSTIIKGFSWDYLSHFVLKVLQNCEKNVKYSSRMLAQGHRDENCIISTLPEEICVLIATKVASFPNNERVAIENFY